MTPVRLETAEDLESAFHLWNTQIFRTIYARVGAKSIAEDITQESFLKAWKKRAMFDPEKASLRTWLFSIALNTMRDYFRLEKKRRTAELPENVPGEVDVHAALLDREDVMRVFREMRAFPAREQELLTLRYVTGLTIKEIGKILKMNESAVKVAIHRARKKLRNRCNEGSGRQKTISTLVSSRM